MFLHSKKIEFIIFTGGFDGFKFIITLFLFIPESCPIARWVLIIYSFIFSLVALPALCDAILDTSTCEYL